MFASFESRSAHLVVASLAHLRSALTNRFRSPMYGPAQVARVLEMVESGQSFSAISRVTGVSRAAIRSWARGDVPGKPSAGRPTRLFKCAVCSSTPQLLPPGPYAYLLGLYLGDGCISRHRNGVYVLRISCCDAYPALMDECELAMSEVLPNRVCRNRRIGCTEIVASSKHWPCLFPQHGPGPKHRRSIVLADWQQSIVDRFPAPFLRGLIHSDGCRTLNRVNATAYPRYHFSNASADIRSIFGRSCDRLGVEWRQNNARNLSVARRTSVAILDEFVGPKR
jgi:hypothetical protein